MEIIQKDNVIKFPERYEINGFQEIFRHIIIPYDCIGETSVKEFSFPDEDNEDIIITRIVVKIKIASEKFIYIVANDENEAYEIDKELKKIRILKHNKS